MKTCNSLFLAVFLAAAASLPASAADTRLPVLVLLHSRFDDHVTMGIGEDRLFRLIRLTETLQKEFPGQNVHVSCEFSGPFVLELAKTPTGAGYIQRIKELVSSGVFDVGYIGENEPTYRNRPKAKLTAAMTPEQRWQEQVDVAGRALSDYRNYYTGEQDSARAGALRAVRQVVGDPSIFGVFVPELGAEGPYYHQLRRIPILAVVPGLPDPYYTMNIPGYRTTVELGAKAMGVPGASPELFWDSGFLRASFTSTADMRRFRAEEGKEAVSKAVEKFDRSRVRLMQMEIVGHNRYLDQWPDGTPKLTPLVWAYDHPDDPALPNGIKAFATSDNVMKAYAAEEETLRWLFDSFLPANPGSRIVSPRGLLKSARTPVGREFSGEVLALAAKDFLDRTSKEVNMPATFVFAGGEYFSAADLFQMLANGLSAIARDGKRPASVRLTHMYGPFTMENTEETFPQAEFPASEVARVAAGLAAALNDQTWRPVPSNAVPSEVRIGGKRLIPGQFLALMAEAYLAPSPDTKIKLRYFQPLTAPGLFFPRQNWLRDGGHIWTLRPAPLQTN